MNGNWLGRLGSKKANGNGPGPRPAARRRRPPLDLMIQELEARTLLSVTASVTAAVLDVELGAAGDHATISRSGPSIVVSGTGFAAQSFGLAQSIVVRGTNTATRDDPNQGVVFDGGSYSLRAAAGTDALLVAGVTSVDFRDVTIGASSGDIVVRATETASADSSGVLGTAATTASVSLAGANLSADNVTLEAHASSSYASVEALGGSRLKEFPASASAAAYGFAAAIAEVRPTATVEVGGASTVVVNGPDGNVTIGADVEAKVDSRTKVGSTALGSALNPTDAAIAASVVDSTAIAHVGGGSTVSAGDGDVAALSVRSSNRTEVATRVDGSAALGGATAALTLDNSTSRAYVDGGSRLKGGSVDVSASTANTAETVARATASGAGANAAIKNLLAGQVDPTYLDDHLKPDPARKTSPATTAASGGLPIAVSAAVAITRFTPTTEASIDSSTVTATGQLSVVARSANRASSDTDSSTTTANARVGVGVAVAIDDAVSRTTATVSSTSGPTALTAPTILVQAAIPGAYGASPDTLDASAKATSGSSGTAVGVAGALALNIVADSSEATVPAGSTVSLVGDVTFNAQDAVTESATAHPPEEEVGGVGDGRLGVGASVALNVVGNTTMADIQDGAQVLGAHDLALNAGSRDAVGTNAVAGASGGAVSVSPSVGISVVTNTTAAQVGKPDANNDALQVGGGFSAAATHAGLASTPTGAASGAGAAASAGVAIALAYVTDRTTATTLRSIDAAGGGVTLRADGSAASLVSANASATGGPTRAQEASLPNSGPADGSKAGPGSDTADPNSVDGQNAQQRAYADRQSGTLSDAKGKPASPGDTKQKANTPAAATADGSVTVAAAVAVNIVDSHAVATIPAGLSITAAGPLTLEASNDTGDPANPMGLYGDTANAYGTNAGTAAVGIGAAVALNLVDASAEATVHSTAARPTTVRAVGASLDAGMALPGPMNTFGALAVSGAGATGVGLAGSLAINIARDASLAVIEAGASVDAGQGDVSLTAANNATDTTLALPGGSGAAGGTVGIGASVALNIVTDLTQSEVQDGAALTNAGNVKVAADSNHSIVTWGQNGAAGDVALGGGVAVAIADDRTIARIGAAAQPLRASGDLTLGASGSFSVNSLADSTAAATGPVGIGASVVVNVAQDSFLAELGRGVVAGGLVGVTAAGTAGGQATAFASEEGAPPAKGDGTDKTADQQSRGQTDHAKGEAGPGSPNVPATPKANDKLSAPSAKATAKSGGKDGQTQVGLAAAIAVNALTTSNVAKVDDGLSVAAGGALTVATTNQTVGLALADGRADKNKLSIGAAVSLNVVDATNAATIGAGDTVAAAGVAVTALMAEGRVDDFSTQGIGVATGSQAGVAGSAGINVITTRTQASIGAGTAVGSTGGLTVRAAEDETLQDITFTVALGDEVGAGAAVDVNVLDNQTRALLDTGVRADAVGPTLVAAGATLAPSRDAFPNAPADALIATGNVEAGQAEVTGINGAINGVLGRSSIAPRKGELVVVTNTATGESTPNAITKFDNVPFDAVLTFGSGVVALDLATANRLNLWRPADDPITLLRPKLKVGQTVGGPGVAGGATITAIAYDPLHGARITLSAPVIVNGHTSLTATTLKLLAPAGASGPVTLVELNAENTLADQFSKLHPTNFAAAAGVSAGGTAIAGAATINVITQATTARIGDGARLNQNPATPAGKAQSVTVTADDALSLLDVTGGLAAGGENGAGAGLDVGVFTEDTEASIGKAAKVAAGGGLSVAARSAENLDATAVQLSAGGELALAGAIAVEVLDLTTKAYVDDGSTLSAQGNVVVQTQQTPTIRTIAGNVAVGGDAGIGASVSTVVLTGHSEASLGANDAVTARGNRGPAQVLDGVTPGGTVAATGVAVQAATVPTLTTIAAGGAASGGVGISGSATVNVLDFTTRANIGSGSTIDATNGVTGTGPGVDVLAYAPLSLSSTADALAAGGEVGAGAGVDVGALTKHTEAWISPATVTADGNLLVQATSTETINSLTASAAVGVDAGIAASGGIYVVGTTTRAFIGDDPAHPIGNPPATMVTAHGSILVAARETTGLDVLSGNLTGSGGLAVGAAVIVPVIHKTTEAFLGADAHVTAWGQGTGVVAQDGQFRAATVAYGPAAALPKPGGKANVSDPKNGANNDLSSPWFAGQQVYVPSTQTVHGLAVTATNQDDIEGVGIDAGASVSVAINTSGSIGVIDDTTHATIGRGAVVDSVNPDTSGGQPLGSVLVAAGNATSFLAMAGAVSISGDLSVTPGVVVLVITDRTLAEIADGAHVTARGDVAVRAHSTGDVFAITATGAGSATVGISGSLAFLDVVDTTRASIGTVAAADSSPAVVRAGGNALVEAADDTSAYLITGSVAIGVTGGGIGASVSIALLTKDTEAYIGSFDTVDALGNSGSLSGIIDGDAYAGGSSFPTLPSFHGVAVQAASREAVTNFAAAGAGGLFVGLAGGIAVEVFHATTLAFVGNNAQVNTNAAGAAASQGVNVSATDRATDFSFAGGLGVGLAGIAGGLDVGLLQNATQAYIMPNATVDARQDVGVFALADDNVKTYALAAGAGAVGLVGSVSVWSLGQAYAAGYQDGNAKDGTVSAVPAGKLSGPGTQTSGAESQTHSASMMTGGLTDPKSNGAAGNSQYISPTVGSNQGGVNGSVVGDPVDAALKAAAPMGTGASLGSGVNVNAGGDVEVEAKSQVAYTTIVGGVAAGIVAVGGSVAVATIQGGTQGSIGAGSQVSAGGTVAVVAGLVGDTADGTAFVGTAGIVAVGAQVIDIQDSSAESANVGDNATVAGTAGVRVQAASRRSATARAAGASFGDVAAGVGVAIADETGGPSARVGSGDKITSGGGIAVGATSVDVADADSYGVTAGAHGAATGVYASAQAAPTTAAAVGDNTTLAAGGPVSVAATATPAVDAVAFGVAVSGAYAIGAVVSQADAAGTTSSDLGNNVSITAPSLAVNATRAPDAAGDPTARSSSTAGVGGILVGVNITVSTATAGGEVRATTGSSDLLPDGDATIAATNSSDQSADATGVAVGGLLAIGGDVATAGSDVTTRALLGPGVRTNNTRKGALTIHATGTDQNDATSVAGSGGLIAGDASVGVTNDTSTVNATLGGPAAGGAMPIIFAGVVDLSATNNSVFTPDVSSVNAAVAGASGAVAKNTDNIGANAAILGNTAIRASSAVDVAARNTFRERTPAGGSNVAAGAGGVFNAAAAVSETNLTGNAVVAIGGSVAVDVQAPAAASSGIFLLASSLLDIADKVTLSSGGAIEGAGTDSRLSATLTNTVAVNSTAAAPDALSTNQNIGNGTYTRANAGNSSTAHTFGVLGTLAASAAGTGVTTNQSVTLGPAAALTAYQNIRLTAGDDPTSGADTPSSLSGFADAESYARGFVGVPIADARTNLVSNATLTVGLGDVIQSGANTALAADTGTPSAQAQGVGHGYQLYFIPVTDGTSTPTVATRSTVTVDGSVTAGIFADLDIAVTSPTTATFTERDTTLPVPSSFRYLPSYNPAAIIAGSGLGATAKQLLLAGVSSTPVAAIGLGLDNPLSAYGGNVTVDAGTFLGTGKITAHGSPTIRITNPTADYLILGPISVPDIAAGHVVYKGTATTAPAGLSVAELGAGGSPIVDIQELYSQSVGNSAAGPAVFLTGEINNLGGQVTVYDAFGSIAQLAAINANQVSIAAPNGSLVIDAPAATEFTGSSPYSAFNASMIWPGGNPATQATLDPKTAVAYAANAQFNANGQFGTNGTNAAADQAFTAALIGHVGDTPSSAFFTSAGVYTYPAPPTGPTRLAGTSIEYFGANSGDDSLLTSAFAASQSPVGLSYAMRKSGGDSAFMPVTPVEPLGTSVGAYPSTPSPVSFTATLTAGSATLTNLSSAAGLTVGASVSGVGIPFGTTILGIAAAARTITLSAAPTISATETLATAASAINAGKVAIRAAVVDIDGAINVGLPNNWSVDLPASLAAVINADRAKGGSALYDLPVSTISAGDNLITAQYDAVNDQVIVNDVNASSGAGFITIDGRIISTNLSGVIHVNNGNGNVAVNNQTGTAVVVRNVFAGRGTGGTSPFSEVDLIDRQANLHTDYLDFPNGRLLTYRGTADQTADQLKPVATPPGTGGSSTSYTPQAGLRYQWQLQASLGRTVAAVQNASNVPPYTSTPWHFNAPAGESNANNPWAFLDASGNPTPVVGGLSTPAGTLVQGAANGPAFAETIGGKVSTWDSFYYTYHDGHYGFKPTNPAFHAPDGREEDPWAYFMPVLVQLTLTDSVKADNPIGITFAGGARGSVGITSNAPVVESGHVVNPTGTTTINAPSIAQTPTADVTTRSLTLVGGGIGTAARPIHATLTGGVLAATASNSGLFLDLASGVAVSRATAGVGPVVIGAAGDITAAPGAVGGSIIGGAVTLVSRGGQVGTPAAPLGISAAGAVNVSALKGISLTQTPGDLIVGQIISATGDVTLNVPNGQIATTGATTWAGVTTDAASQRVWTDLGLTNPAAPQVKQAVVAFQGQVDAEYQEYWQLLGGGTVAGGVLTLTPPGVILFRPRAAAALGAADPAKVTDAQVQAYANDRYLRAVAYFDKVLPAGWRTSADFRAYNPSFHFTATARQQSDLTSNAVWTAGQLSNTVLQGALDPSLGGLEGISTPVIAGANVSLTAAGNIGQVSAPLDIPLSALRAGTLSPAQLAALSRATAPGAVLLEGLDAANHLVAFAPGHQPANVAVVSGIRVSPQVQVIVGSSTLAVDTKQGVAVQGAAGDVVLKGVKAGGSVNIAAPGSILGAKPGTTITTPGGIILKAQNGDIGQPASPLLVPSIDGVTAYVPRGNAYFKLAAGGGGGGGGIITPPAAATGLAISPDSGTSATDGVTNTGTVTLTGNLGAAGLAVEVFDTSTGKDLGYAAVVGTSFSLALNGLAEGSHALRVRVASTNGLSTDATFTVLVDSTAPTSHAVALDATQAADSFPVTVVFADPSAAGAGAAVAGVTSVALFVSTNGGPFARYKTQTFAPTAAGTATFTFAGQDRNHYAFRSVARDAAGNAEAKGAAVVEAGTDVPDLNPPVTHVLDPGTPGYSWSPFPSSTFAGLAPSSYAGGVFTLRFAGADPDMSSGVPAGSIAQVSIYVIVDGGAPALVGRPSLGAPDGRGVYTGSLTYPALGDGKAHTYGFYSVGVDDLSLRQYGAASGPATPDVTFRDVTATKTATTTAVTPKVAATTYGHPVTLTATVTSAVGTPPDGGVQLYVDGLPVGEPVPLGALGTATLDLVEPVGVYTVTARYTGDATYAGTTAAGAASARLTVGRASPTITWPRPAGIAYGTPLGVAQLDATADVPGTFTYSPALGAILGAGTGRSLSATFTPLDAADYAVVTATTTIDVARAFASIRVNAYAATYDARAHVATGSAAGIGGVNLNADLDLTGTTHTDAGTYPDTWSFHDPAGNYADASGSIGDWIVQAALRITADDASRSYGAPNPTFTATYAGFAPGDRPASLGGSATFRTSAGLASPVGNYDIVPGGLTSTNYAITFVPGTLAVGKASLTLTADDADIAHGDAIPTLTYTVGGFLNGDTASVL